MGNTCKQLFIISLARVQILTKDNISSVDKQVKYGFSVHPVDDLGMEVNSDILVFDWVQFENVFTYFGLIASFFLEFEDVRQASRLLDWT